MTNHDYLEHCMTTQIFVNLPVNKFTDETGTSMIVGENIFVMLLTRDKFKAFTPNPICDATKSTEVLVALNCENREQVDTQVRKAVAAGGSTYNAPQDHGFMYAHGFQDLDGHIWELFYMDESAIPQ